MKQSIEILNQKGVKPTPNRILVLNALLQSHHPQSMVDLDQAIGTMDRSSIFRVLTLFHQSDIVHTIEDGSGSLKYEVCHGHEHCSIDDMHAHFYCEQCQRTFCFEEIPIPTIDLPAGYTPHSINYMVKGLCPDCASSARHEE